MTKSKQPQRHASAASTKTNTMQCAVKFNKQLRHKNLILRIRFEHIYPWILDPQTGKPRENKQRQLLTNPQWVQLDKRLTNIIDHCTHWEPKKTVQTKLALTYP